MDPRLEQALEFANYQKTINQERDKLKDWLSVNLRYADSGGIFSLTPEFLSFVNMLAEKNQTQVVLIDNNNIPVQIDDVRAFSENITNKYFEVTNDYHHKFYKLVKSRTVEKAINW